MIVARSGGWGLDEMCEGDQEFKLPGKDKYIKTESLNF